jgi:SAM-dependent methyltransferase
MKNREKWVPNKYVYKNGKLLASRDTREVGVASRLITDIIAALYDTYIPQYAKGNLIDLGCGEVPLYEVYRPYTTDNVCVDWENSLHPGMYVDQECDLARKLPFSDGEFDTLILSDVLEHILKPDTLWKEISRLLSLGGIAFINTPFFYCLHEIPNDYFRYTEFALKHFAETNGFKILILRSIGGTPEILGDIFAKHFIHIPMIGRFLAIGVQEITKAFISTSLGKRISAKSGRIFPLGYFLILEKQKSPIVIT